MAARLTNRYGEKWRTAIQVGMLKDRLEKHALGECEMSQTQIRAAEILLKKAMPDLSAVTIDGDGEGGPINVRHSGLLAVYEAVPSSADSQADRD